MNQQLTEQETQALVNLIDEALEELALWGNKQQQIEQLHNIRFKLTGLNLTTTGEDND